MSYSTAPRFPAACTVVSRNYLSDARVVAESYLKHHPGAHFYTLVIDGDEGGKVEQALSPARFITPDDLDTLSFSDLSFRCTATELCCTLKPGLIRLLFRKYHEREVIYFDSDLLIMRRLDEAIGALATTSILLTPHLLKPIPRDGLRPAEEDILQAGAFNLGFLAV